MTDAPDVEVLTAADAEEAQARAAGALAAAGACEGDRVAFCLPSSAALLCAVLGALRVGIVPVLLNATLTDVERDLLVDDADPALVVSDADALARLDAGPPVALWPRSPAPVRCTTPRAPPVGPRGCGPGLWDTPTAAHAFADEADLWGFGPRRRPPRVLAHVPLGVGALRRGHAIRGGTCVILGHFDAGRAAEALEGAYGPMPTTTFLAPSALARLLALPATAPGPVRLPPPPGPRRVGLPAGAQAGRPRRGGARRPLGVLRLDRRPVHRVPARRMARATGHRRAGAAGAGR